jgi:protein subunit release factor A
VISLNLVLAGLRLGLKNRQVDEKWVSVYKLAEIMEGDLESVIEPLIVEQQTSQLSELNDAL